ncbi:MAG: ABC transporter ATP-binding protein [Rhizobiaceae bacterium]|nr:ABC transporter ATP-binding protein [Rhizobiaceae bacterium]
MLVLDKINAGYGSAQILRDVSLEAKPGEILCLFGRNGAGKTTIMKAIMGLVRTTAGVITLGGQNISRLRADQIPKCGIGYIPQGRRLFSELTVEENIEAGLLVSNGGQVVKQRVLDMFPPLKSRLDQQAGTLSGGEQQMLATARALAIEPKVLLLDEPTEGLQPSMIEQIRNVVVQMRDEGVAVILVEQRVDAVLSIANRVTFIENGYSRETLNASVLNSDKSLLDKYVGV